MTKTESEGLKSLTDEEILEHICDITELFISALTSCYKTGPNVMSLKETYAGSVAIQHIEKYSQEVMAYVTEFESRLDVRSWLKSEGVMDRLNAINFIYTPHIRQICNVLVNQSCIDDDEKAIILKKGHDYVQLLSRLDRVIAAHNEKTKKELPRTEWLDHLVPTRTEKFDI
jgi:hypothetical protein